MDTSYFEMLLHLIISFKTVLRLKQEMYQGSTLSIARLPRAGKLGVGQVIPDTYLPEGQVKFLEKFSNISSLIKEIIGRAGIIIIWAGKF